MTRIEKARNAGVAVAVVGAVAWIVALEGLLRTANDGTGANIGAGILLLAGRGLVGVGLIVVVVFAVIGAVRR